VGGGGGGVGGGGGGGVGGEGSANDSALPFTRPPLGCFSLEAHLINGKELCTAGGFSRINLSVKTNHQRRTVHVVV